MGLPRTTCPQCGKEMTKKALQRHTKEQNSNDSAFPVHMWYMQPRHQEESWFGWSYEAKTLATKKTWSTKKSHKRITRITWSKYRQDRKYQNQVPERPESNQVIRMLPLDQLQTSLTTGMPLLMQKCVNLKKNWRKKTNEFPNWKNYWKKKIEKDLEIRLRILENKLNIKDKKEIDLNAINSILMYFNLNSNCTRNDIRDVVNMRVMEMSPESLIENGVNEGMSDAEREQFTSLLNPTLVKLLQWKDEQKTMNKKTE